MEIIILIAIVGIAYLYISNNSRKVKDETVITTTQTVKTQNGEQTITRTTTINDVQTDVRHPNTSMNFPEHRVVQPLNQQHSPQQSNTQARVEKAKPTISHSPQPQVKECSGCKRVQPVSEFNKNSNQPDGFAKWCKTCMTIGVPNPPDMKGKKVCDRCGEIRLKTSFYPTTKYADGLSKWCKFCLSGKK